MNFSNNLSEMEAERELFPRADGFGNNLSLEYHKNINPKNFSMDSDGSKHEPYENKFPQLGQFSVDGDAIPRERLDSGAKNLDEADLESHSKLERAKEYEISRNSTPSVSTTSNSEKQKREDRKDLTTCNLFSKSNTNLKGDPIEIETDSGGDTAVSKFTGPPGTRFKNSNRTASVCNVKTLEDSFRRFEFDPSLQTLEKSLEDLRRHKTTVEDHNSLIKRLEKSIIQRSMEHHPDKVQSRGGSEEEILDAQRLQTALNSTKKAMNILNKIFLEEIDVDHKYGYYTNLDISLLGNEDEIECHVYDVLFKINLISEIKERDIISKIRKFLSESQKCITSYIEENVHDFETYLHSAICCLRLCIRGYDKLLWEFEEVAEECVAEEQDNISSLIRKMKENCSRQLDHLVELLKVVELCLHGNFQIFTCAEDLDDYFVCPFVCYINVILMCNVFVRKPSRSRLRKLIYRRKILPAPTYNEQTRFLTSLYHLASYYSGSKDYENSVPELLGHEYFRKDSVQEKFLDILLKEYEYLRNKFKIDEYEENGSRRRIVEELKKCEEMKTEFEEKKEELMKDIGHVKKDTQKMKKQLDKIMNDREERRKEYEACLLENSELQARFARWQEKH